MKGTLYSADFVKTPNGIKLLELNTDTAFMDSQIDNFNFGEFINTLSENNITTVHVVYKDFQEYFITHLSQSLHESASFVTSFIETEEHSYTIYPADITDSDDTFILRCAYNESAIFDSMYCKDGLGLYDMMADGEEFFDNSEVVNYYYSSSIDGVVKNYLAGSYLLNTGSTIPDIIIKDTLDSPELNPGFYKLNSNLTGSDEELILSFIEETKVDGRIYMPYYDTLNGGTHTKSIRTANILYGSNLDNISLYKAEVQALFDIPSDTQFEIPTGSEKYVKYPVHHLYEFATNAFKFDYRNQKGISAYELLESGSEKIHVKDLIEGNQYKSVRIPSLPDSDNMEALMSWSVDGSSLPADSVETSSVLISKNEYPNLFGVYHELIIDSASVLTGPALPILVHDSREDVVRYEYVYNLDKDVHSIFKVNGETASLDELNFYVSSDVSASTFDLDFEDDDTFIISDLGVRIVAHNIRYAPTTIGCCFPAGTLVTMADGTTKPIELIEVGDEVVTEVKLTSDEGIVDYSTQDGLVLKLHPEHTVGSHMDACKKLGYTDAGLFSLSVKNNEGVVYDHLIKFTPEHPFLTKRGWAALVPDERTEPWISEQTEALKLEVGDFVLNGADWDEIVEIHFDHTVSNDIPVYNITVSKGHSYYANGFLVHNK